MALQQETLKRIDSDANDYLGSKEAEFSQRSFNAYLAGATEYAIKLHQANEDKELVRMAYEGGQQEIKELKQWKKEATELLNPILDYGQSKEAGIGLGESITAVVLERCKQTKQAKQLLFRLASFVNAEQSPDDKFLTEIKTFLDGK